MGGFVHRETQGHLELATRGTTPVDILSVLCLVEDLVRLAVSFSLHLEFSLPRSVGGASQFSV